MHMSHESAFQKTQFPGEPEKQIENSLKNESKRSISWSNAQVTALESKTLQRSEQSSLIESSSDSSAL
jgi:hypothetical protein